MQSVELNAMPVEVSTTEVSTKASRKTLIQRVALVFVALLAFGAVALNAYEPSSELGSLRGSVMNMCRWWDAGCHARAAARKAAEWALARKRELEAAAARAAAEVKAAAE